MKYTHAKKKKNRNGLLALLLAVVFLLSGAITFLFLGGLDLLAFFAVKAPRGYTAQGNVQALRLENPKTSDAKELTAYFEGAVGYAKAQGYNTLIFNGKEGLQVYWKDKIFEPAQSSDTDMLALLCQAAEGQDLQIWVELDPYQGGQFQQPSKSKLAAYMEEKGLGKENFSMQDEEYTRLLVKSLSHLPVSYSISGILLTGFTPQASPDLSQEDFDASLQGMVESLHTGLADNGRLIPISLSFAESGDRVTPKLAAELVNQKLISYVLPSFTQSLQDIPTRVSAFGGSGFLSVPPLTDTSGIILYTSSLQPSYAGLVLGSYPEKPETQDAVLLALGTLQAKEEELPAPFELPQILGIDYPAQNAKIYTDKVFVMGSSDPGAPLTVNGKPVENRAAKGIFGVEVELVPGENSFTFAQNDHSVTLRLNRVEPQPGTPRTYPHDNVQKAEPGQVVYVSSQISNVLTDPANNSSINETFHQGATFIVEESVETRYGNNTSWAYKLKSGDYVMGYNCQWKSTGGQAAFTSLSAQEENGNEWITFEGEGTPAAYVAFDNATGVLSLTFYDTTIQLPEGFSSKFIQSAWTEQQDQALILHLQTQGIWGYNLEYTDGKTRLFLKEPPHRSSEPGKPLAGVTIVLDPGHGDTDIGSPGVLWSTGPHEKDMNLSLALTTAWRLRQMGAEVIMTRDNDSFPSLNDRLQIQTDLKPDLFLSMHHNAMEPDKDLNDAKGVEGYYYHPYNTPNSQQLAQNILDRVAPATGRKKRKDAAWGAYYVTRTTVCPSVLFEYGFAVNPAEYVDVTSQEGIYLAALATADGILQTIPE